MMTGNARTKMDKDNGNFGIEMFENPADKIKFT